MSPACVSFTPTNLYDVAAPIEFITATIKSAIDRLNRRNRLAVRSSLNNKNDRMILPDPSIDSKQMTPIVTWSAIIKSLDCAGKEIPVEF